MDFASGIPAAAPGVAATILLTILLRLWLLERAHHSRERDAIISSYQRKIDQTDRSHAEELRNVHLEHAEEVKTWRRRLQDCEEQFRTAHLGKRWYDRDTDTDAPGGDDGT